MNAYPKDLRNGITYLYEGDVTVVDGVITEVDGVATDELFVIPHTMFYRVSIAITATDTVQAKIQYTIDNPSSPSPVYIDWPGGVADGAGTPTRDGGVEAPIGAFKLVVLSGTGTVHVVVRENLLR